jgi:endonuclease/exonuclease/phosphatase family metal-dependent hydrolase
MKIRVATYNIHKGVSSFRSTPRVLALKKAIGAFDADVVFLQEVQGRHDRYQARYAEKLRSPNHHWPEKAQHEFFAGEGLHSAYGMNAVYDHGHHGNALLSALPDREPEQPRRVRPRLRAARHPALRGRGRPRPVHCYVMHLGLFEQPRRQTDALINAPSTIRAERRAGDHRRRLQRLAQYALRHAAPRSWAWSRCSTNWPSAPGRPVRKMAGTRAAPEARRAPFRRRCPGSARPHLRARLQGRGRAGAARSEMGQAVRSRAHRGQLIRIALT